MKVTSFLFATMSGKMGGVVAAHNRYGSYLRNKVIPVNPQSTRQEAMRAIFQYLTNLWNSSSMAAYRAGWDLYAANVKVKDRNGNAQNITGFNMFIRCNSVRYMADAWANPVPPSVMSLPEVDAACSATISAATQNMSVQFTNTLPWANEENGKLCVFQGQPILGNRNFFKGPWRYAGKITGHLVGPPADPYTVACSFPVAAGQLVYVKFRVSRADGRLSEPFLCHCTVGT